MIDRRSFLGGLPAISLAGSDTDHGTTSLDTEVKRRYAYKLVMRSLASAQYGKTLCKEILFDRTDSDVVRWVVRYQGDAIGWNDIENMLRDFAEFGTPLILDAERTEVVFSKP